MTDAEPGVVGLHPPHPRREILAAPTTGEELNTVKAALIPFACWRINDVRFAFTSSFVQPDVNDELAELRALIEEHSLGDLKPPLSVFGHADPVGDDDFNKMLSGRRAKAIYALLIRDVEIWEALYSKPLGDDDWSRHAVGIMLSTVAPPDDDEDTRIRTFQQAEGLAADGIVGPNTRGKLFERYMEALCGDFRLQAGDILFLNNWVTFHRRTAFEDHSEPERRRHLMRMWLSVPNSRPLDPRFEEHFGATAAGALRGGMRER